MCNFLKDSGDHGVGSSGDHGVGDHGVGSKETVLCANRHKKDRLSIYFTCLVAHDDVRHSHDVGGIHSAVTVSIGTLNLETI